MARLTEVPGKPGWRQSAVLDDEGEDVDLGALYDRQREKIARQYPLQEYHVFWAWNPADDTEPPEGWEEKQKEKSRKWYAGIPAEEVERAMANVNFDYRPFRVFVVPRAGLGEVIRHFRVGSYYEDEDAYIDQVAERVVAADRIVPLTVTHAYLSSVSLVFIDSATEEQCRELQELFPFEREGDMSLGLEAYLSDWSPERGPWFLAEWFHRDQRIDLWWD